MLDPLCECESCGATNSKVCTENGDDNARLVCGACECDEKEGEVCQCDKTGYSNAILDRQCEAGNYQQKRK